MGNSIYWGKYRALLPRQLALYVPTDWHFEVEDLRDQPVDALLHIKSPDGRSGTVALEFQAALTPSTARRALAQLARSSADDTLLVAPYISPQTQRFLREQSASYLDFAGNVHWRLHSPAMFISATSNAPSPEKRPTGRTLSGAKAGRLIRYLCDELPPFTVTRLARELDMDYGNVSRYLNLLERDALITRTSRGPVTEVDWEGVLRRWSEDYRPPSMERYLSTLVVRGGSFGCWRLPMSGTLSQGLPRLRYMFHIRPPRVSFAIAIILVKSRKSWNCEKENGMARFLVSSPIRQTWFIRTRGQSMKPW